MRIVSVFSSLFLWSLSSLFVSFGPGALVDFVGMSTGPEATAAMAGPLSEDFDFDFDRFASESVSSPRRLGLGPPRAIASRWPIGFFEDFFDGFFEDFFGDFFGDFVEDFAGVFEELSIDLLLFSRFRSPTCVPSLRPSSSCFVSFAGIEAV